MNRAPARQVVFIHGDETFNADGTSTRTVVLRAFVGKLPRGMFCRYTVTSGRDSESFPTWIEATIQARAPGGRRYWGCADEIDAQARILKWANRVLREIEAEDEALAQYRGGRNDYRERAGRAGGRDLEGAR